MRKSRCRVSSPVACVFVLARLNCTSGASVPAVSPVSAPPVRVKSGVEPVVLAAELIEIVPVAMSPAMERSPEIRASPWTESGEAGVVVPIPTLPEESIRIASAPAVPNSISSVFQSKPIQTLFVFLVLAEIYAVFADALCQKICVFSTTRI